MGGGESEENSTELEWLLFCLRCSMIISKIINVFEHQNPVNRRVKYLPGSH